MKRFLALSLCSFFLLCAAPAQEGNDNKLKNAMMQLRALQTEKATMQAAQAELEAKRTALEAQVKKQAATLEALDKEKRDAERAAKAKQEEQSAAIARLVGDLARYKKSLDKWQAAHATITDIAKKKEVERAKLSAKSSDLERQVADLRRRNVELYKVGTEILDRYKAMGLGEALSVREPFTGNARVRLQNIVQDYGDKLLDQTAKP